MRRLAFIICIVWLLGCLSAMAATPTVKVSPKLNPQPIPPGPDPRVALRTPQLLTKLNTQVTLEGFYYDGSIPMIINDVNLLAQDKVLPVDSYVPITGVRPAGVKWGDRLRVTGVIERPTGTLSRETAAIRASGASSFRVMAPTTLTLKPNFSIAPSVIAAVVAETTAPYAVLIAGGASPANNHIRYWNDLSTMYKILRSKGYPANHITVIYANGSKPSSSSTSGGTPVDTTMPVHYSATKANIAAVFSSLASQVGPNNDVYIMLNDHGCTMSGGHTGLCLWSEDMSDTEFAAEVNKITAWNQMMIQMKQCFSGGFVDDLTRANRVVMSSSTAGQVSWAKHTLDYGEFTYYYMSALKGSWVDGAAGAPGGDGNGDGKVSMMEAWNFARGRDTRPETPQYEDNGSAPCHGGGAMPMGGDGPYGGGCWL